MTEELKQVSGEAETVADTDAMDGAAASTVEGSAGSDSALGQAARVITPPAAGQTDVVRLAPGERFELAANPATVNLVVDGNNLVLGFDLDGDGAPDSFVVLEDLVLAAGSTNPPVLMVAGEPIGVDLLIGNAVALSGPQTGGPGTTLETAAEPAAQGGGATAYSDNLGDAIDLLVAQGVIPPVELQFGLIELEDRIDIVEEDNEPPLADPVLTPASLADGGEGGGLPPDLQDALVAVGLDGAPGPEIHSEVVAVAGSGLAGSVQYVYFTLTEPTAVTITTDGPTIDPHMFLFRDDGALDAADFIAVDDDDGLPAGLFSNAIINTGDEIGILPAGNYVVAVGDYQLTLAEAVAGINDSGSFGSQTGNVTVTIQANTAPTVVFFKQLDVDGSIGDDDSGLIADFGGADAETSLENLVFTLQSNPTFGQLILVTAGGDTSFLTPGDTFSSEDTVWWIATEDQIADFLAQPGAPEFLPDVNFNYSVTDEAGGVATAPVAITLPPPTPPRTALGIEQDDCLNEDTEGSLLFAAYPTDGASKISQIVISGFPTGDAADAWVVDETSVDIFGYALGVDYTTSYNALTGELTIDFITASFSLGESVQGTVDVTPNPDSDVDQTMTIEATAINGAGSATDTENSVIVVDAIADGAEGGPGDDGDSDHLSVVATVSDANGEVPENGTFQAGEIGTLNVQATFDDFLDGSETHTLYVYAPAGFTILEVDGESLPTGVTPISNDGGIAIFDVETSNGVGAVALDLQVQNTGASEGTATFYVTATAQETSTPLLIEGDQECDGGEGSNFAYVQDDAVATVAIVTAPEVSLSLYGGGDCIDEDSVNNQLDVVVNPDSDDLLTEVVITGLQAGWTYDFTGLGGAGITVDDSVPGQVTITFDTPSNATYNGSFLATPPADSDEDHPTITVTASVEDPEDAALTADGSDTIDVHVDAVVDGGALVSGTPDISDAGAVVGLNLTLAPQGGNPGNPAGDAHNGGGFDTDGSESVTKVVVTLSGDAGAVLTSSNVALFNDLLTLPQAGQVWTFEGTQAQLVSLMSTLQADPSNDFDGNITVSVDVTTTETATEAGNPAPDGDGANGDHGYECTDENNNVTESFEFTVPVEFDPALNITKTAVNVDGGPLAVDAAGDVINYTITVENTGNATLTNVVVTDPNADTLVRGADVVGDGDDDLEVGETWSYTATHVVTQAEIDNNGGGDGDIDNTATADSDQTGPDDDSAEVPLDQNAALNITKTAVNVDGGPLAVDAAGDVINYTITVENTGNATLTNVVVTDPNADTLVRGADVVGDGDDDLEVGETWSYTATHVVTQAEIDNNGGGDGDIDNTATADSDQTGPDDDSAEVPLDQNAALNITKTATDVDGGPLAVDAAGDVINYTITVENTGNQTLTNVVVTDPNADTLVRGADLVGDNDDDLEVGETWSYTATHVVTQAEIDNNGGGDGDIDNTATADSDQTGPDDDSAEVPLDQNAALNITKTATDVDGGALVVDAAGDVINYTITVENTGNATLTNVVVTDPNADTLVRGADLVGDNDDDLEVGETWNYAATHTVTQAEIDNNGGGDGDIDNTATADSDQTGPDDDSAEVPLDQNAALNITKTATDVDGGALVVDAAGDVINYTITVENTGNQTLTNVVVTDPNADTLVRGADLVGDNDDELEVGETWSYAATHTVTQAEIDNNGGGDGDIDNTATADSDQTGPDDDSAEVPIDQNAALNITKTATDVDGGALVVDAAGDVINYTITVENTGNQTLTNVVVTDPNADTLVRGADLVGDNDDDLEVGETWSYAATHTVTQAEIDNNGDGDIDNTATADSDQTGPDEDSAEVPIEIENREILNTGIITNTNSQGQKGIITFYDQNQILMNAFAGYIVFSIEGQALSQANDTGFIIEPETEYTYGLEADAGNDSRIGLDELSLEGVNLTEPANIFGMGDIGTGGATNFAMSGRFEPDGTEVQVGTASTDGTTGADTINDPTALPTVNYLFGDLGNDTLNGGAGSDILNGGGGSDSLVGGGGNDILVYGVGDTINGGAGDDLIRIDAIGATITTFNDGGDTFINLLTRVTEFDYVSTNIDNVEGLLITDQPIFKAGDIVQGVTLVDSDLDGDIDADDHAFMADIGVRVALDASDVIDHADGDGDVLWIQGNEGDIVNLLDADGANDWFYQGPSGDFATYTWGANAGDVQATVHIEVGIVGDSSIDVQINGTTVLDDGQLVP